MVEISSISDSYCSKTIRKASVKQIFTRKYMKYFLPQYLIKSNIVNYPRILIINLMQGSNKQQKEADKATMEPQTQQSQEAPAQEEIFDDIPSSSQDKTAHILKAQNPRNQNRRTRSVDICEPRFVQPGQTHLTFEQRLAKKSLIQNEFKMVDFIILLHQFKNKRKLSQAEQADFPHLLQKFLQNPTPENQIPDKLLRKVELSKLAKWFNNVPNPSQQAIIQLLNKFDAFEQRARKQEEWVKILMDICQKRVQGCQHILSFFESSANALLIEEVLKYIESIESKFF